MSECREIWWCIQEENGALFSFTARAYRKWAIGALIKFGFGGRKTWKQLYRNGFRAVKIEVRTIGKNR